ncbi:MAG: hypothetical protein C4334_05235 [Pyrinomonas sp.]
MPLGVVHRSEVAFTAELKAVFYVKTRSMCKHAQPEKSDRPADCLDARAGVSLLKIFLLR